MNKRIKVATKDGDREVDIRDDGAYWADSQEKFFGIQHANFDWRAYLRSEGYEILSASDESSDG